MKLKHLFWGIFFIGAAALVIINQLGIFTAIGLPSLVLTLLLLPILIHSAVRLHYFGIFFPAALIMIVYAKPLGIEALVPWPVLIAALFLSIGCSVLSKKRWKSNWFHGAYHHHHHPEIDGTSENIDDDEIYVAESFGSSSKYLKSSSLRKAHLKCSFGALKVYFDTATLHPDGAEAVLDASFAGVELYIPKTWRVRNGIEATIGGVDEKYHGTPLADGPLLTLSGHISFGGVEIYYV